MNKELITILKALQQLSIDRGECPKVEGHIYLGSCSNINCFNCPLFQEPKKMYIDYILSIPIVNPNE